MRLKTVMLISSFLLSLLLFLNIACSESSEQAVIFVDEALKKEVVAKTAEYMKDFYYNRELGGEMSDYISGKYVNGDYKTFTDLKKFCRQLTTDLRAVCHDRHIFVFYAPGEAKEVAANLGLLSPEETEDINAKKYERSRKSDFGFHEIKVLDGNIGYLDLHSFSNPDWARETAIQAMTKMAETDAIMVDLRKNGGGKGTMVKYLSSYFFGLDSVPMSFTVYRSGDTVECWTDPLAPAFRFPEKALYILTSRRTFSAGEEFAYNMKVMERGTLVGEPTKGGAHPVEVKIIKGSILTQISIGNSFHPYTGENWEESGVSPDIAVPEAVAFNTAYLEILRMLEKKTVDQERKKYLRSLIMRYNQ